MTRHGVGRPARCVVALLLAAAEARGQSTAARRVEAKPDLPQGRAVLGRVGDYLLENDRIRVIIDAVERRSGFAESGGNIVDAARIDDRLDMLAQLTTYFDDTFPRQAVYERLEIVAPGGRGVEARIRVAGRELRNPRLRVTTDYSLRPGEPWVRIDTSVVNAGAEAVRDFELGDAVQWGLTEHFAEGVGFNLGGRTLAQVEWLAGQGAGVSYGYTVASGTFSGPNGSNWSDANVARADLAPGVPVTFTRYLVVGTGDVASVTDAVYSLRGRATGTLVGRLAEKGGATVEGGLVEVRRPDGAPLNQIRPRPDGTFRAALPAGEYLLVPSAPGRAGAEAIQVRVASGAETPVRAVLGAPGRLRFRFTAAGRPLPVKVTLVGLGSTPDPSFGPLSRAAGTANVVFSRTGAEEVRVPPGLYTVHASCGLEYTLFSRRIEIGVGAPTEVAAELARVVDTRGAVSADFHLHSEYSTDSNVPLRDKVIGLAAEGVEIAVATDHNFVTDYGAAIRELGLELRLKSIAGNEVTVPDLLHLNVFPLESRPTLARNGALDPTGMKAQAIVDALRGGPGDEVIQLNHPRAGNIGYFAATKFDSLAVRSPDPSFTLDFDAIEIFNGKRVADTEPVLRDWFNLLNAGHRFTATGNSDSHKLVSEESGYPRNFILLGKDDPAAVTDAEVVAAVKAHRVVVTNGPFVRVRADGRYGIGDTIRSGGRAVTIAVEVQGAPWVDVTEVALVENGRTVARRLVAETAAVDRGTHAFTVTPRADAWYVVVVRGNRGLQPVVPRGAAREVLPLAFTNPIWVDADGDGAFTPPARRRAP